MGKRDRERIARIIAGEEEPIAGGRASMVVGTTTLESFSTSNQIKVLADSLHSGRLSSSELKEALVNNARKEMLKGVKKLMKRKKIPTVDLLLEEYRADKAFQDLANEVGLDEGWFMGLAKTVIYRWEVGRL